ncbi:MAG TPA: 30S ribosomal protein S14 [Thermoanaerobaculia bacterium]|nr:30S ribosomal protein S14 [Thermoanaerobaculia bacterium]
MASKAAISKNDKRKQMVERKRERRQELKEIIRDPKTPEEERQLAIRQLNQLPRDSSPVRVRNRCALTGRPRAYYRKFGLSRIALRDLALRGELPGVTKASW